jgi:hypothetical protein
VTPLNVKLVSNSCHVGLKLRKIVIVDSWLTWRRRKGSANGTQQKEFYFAVAEELIDNNFDRIGRRERQCVADESEAMVNGEPRSGLISHISPTNLNRRRLIYEVLAGARQWKCRICGQKTTLICSECKDRDLHRPEPCLCTTKNGTVCFTTHMALKHGSCLSL